MSHPSPATAFEHASLCLPGLEPAACADFVPHPAFPGVRLKHLVLGTHTDGALSRHLVQVDPGCALRDHVHPAQWELHEVLQGAGQASLHGQPVIYEPGRLAVIPQGLPHEVQAGPSGLVLLATFFPALM